MKTIEIVLIILVILEFMTLSLIVLNKDKWCEITDEVVSYVNRKYKVVNGE